MQGLSIFVVVIAVLAGSVVAWGEDVKGPGAPSGLMVDLLRWPEETVVTDVRPRFSWVVNDSRRGAVQSVYQVRVVGKDGKGVWDSGKVESGESVAVGYGGEALGADRSYRWAVRTWDGAGRESPWSEGQWFNVGDVGRAKGWAGESRWVSFVDYEGKERRGPEDRQGVGYHDVGPVAVGDLGGGTWGVDFGRAAFGMLRVVLASETEGRVVRIRLGEKRTADGRVDRRPGGSIFHGEYSLTLKAGRRPYELALPRHVSKMPHSLVLPEFMAEVEPFRYAEIEGVEGKLAAGDVRQVALMYPFDDGASSFVSSDADLDAVWGLSKYTMKAAPFMGVYIDGVRERMPYEADCYIEMLGHACCDREYAIGRYSAEFLFHHATWPTEWVLQSVLMAWADYMNTGDSAMLEREYELLKRKTLRELARGDGLISTRTGKVTPAVLAGIHYDGKALRDVVDWPQASETDGYVFGDYNTVVNAFHYRALVLMGEIAGVLGKTSEAEEFRGQSSEVRKSFNAVFFDAARGVYADGEGIAHASLHANAFPLALGLVPAERMKSVAAYVKSRAMACGPYGAQFVVEALYDAGEADAGLGLLTAKGERGWLNMIRAGSTMTTEAWDIAFKKNLTWNHAWGAAPANLIPRKVMGVEVVEPGARRVRVRPRPGGLARAEVKVPTVRGAVEVKYERRGGELALDVVVPANVVAEVWVPTGDEGSVRESGVVPDGKNGVKALGGAKYEVGGGSYHFTATAAAGR